MSNRFSRLFCKLLLGLTALLPLSSCIYDNYDEPASQGSGSVRVVLHINALGPERTSAQSGVTEMVRSLRIIMFNESGALEVNDKITSDETMRPAEGFTYSYMRFLSPGKKLVYLVANEESVGQVQLTDISDLPAGLPTTSLTSLLNHFSANTESPTSGRNMLKVLERVYFKNDDYSVGDNGTIYLPYSTTYELTVEDNDGLTEIEDPLYLVPVATKVDLVFINRRKQAAQVDDVLFCSVNPHNFLNASLDASEQYRQLNGVQTWWVDWLQACAVASQAADDNVAFNKLWGWIKNYQMPLPNESKIKRSLNTAHDLWAVEGLVDKNNPSTLKVGPFYLPESIQLTTHVADDFADPDDAPQPGDQLYTLTFVVRNQGQEEVYTIPGNEIDNLKALFRATHITITAEFFENDVEIYVEVSPWSPKTFWGYVQEES